MREGVKAVASVIGAHAAAADTAEAHVGGGEVDYCVVYTATAEAYARGYFPDKASAVGKNIERERVVVAVYLVDYRLIVIVWELSLIHI